MSPAAIRSALSRLSLATKLLIAVPLVNLLLFLPRTIGAPKELFNVVFIVSALLCIVGFAIGNSVNKMAGGINALGRVGVREVSHASLQVRASVILLFYISFLVPILNVVTAMWALYRVRSAMGVLRSIQDGRLSNEARRREKFGAMGT
jgi:hypothetical protein